MIRRTFIRTTGAAVAAVQLAPAVLNAQGKNQSSVRLGGPVFGPYEGPEEWVELLQKLGYRAAYSPVQPGVAEQLIKDYEHAARDHDIIIAEVGAWSNPISPDDKTRREARQKCRTQLALADRIGANCCVNISGSRSNRWEGPSPDNLTDETFDMIVETTRAIIDDVKPTRTFFTLEMMPWSYPDSPDSYVALLKAIDRKRFAVHLDPVNIVCSPQRYYSTGKLIRECFEKLGSNIKSCHAKDILLDPRLTTHLDEVRPGLGGLDYAVFLKELSKIPDTPLMLEHLKGAEEYRLAAEHVRGVAKEIGLSFG